MISFIDSQLIYIYKNVHMFPQKETSEQKGAGEL